MNLLPRIGRRASDALYWVRYRVDPRHRYHVVKTGLSPSYYDVDTLMLHACMALLCRYVEEEQGGAASMAEYIGGIREPGAWYAESLEAQATYEEEALAIYRWWKTERPADEALHERQLMARYGRPRDPAPFCTEEEFRALESKIEDDEQRMLHRLIEIRGGLWT